MQADSCARVAPAWPTNVVRQPHLPGHLDREAETQHVATLSGQTHIRHANVRLPRDVPGLGDELRAQPRAGNRLTKRASPAPRKRSTRNLFPRSPGLLQRSLPQPADVERLVPMTGGP